MKLSPQAIELLSQTLKQSTFSGELSEVVTEAKYYLEFLAKQSNQLVNKKPVRTVNKKAVRSNNK